MSLPEVLVPAKSPLAVYAKYRTVIESLLAPSMGQLWQQLEADCETKSFQLLIATLDLPDESNTLEDFVQKENERWKEVQQSRDDITPEKLKLEEHISVDFRTVASVVAFISYRERWYSEQIGAKKISDAEAVRDLGLQSIVMPQTTASNPLVPITLDRLFRLFRGTWIISKGPHNERFARVSVRVATPFMENVIKTKAKQHVSKRGATGAAAAAAAAAGSPSDQRSRKIPISGLSIYGPATLASAETYYVTIPLEFVLVAVSEAIKEVSAVREESKDDVM